MRAGRRERQDTRRRQEQEYRNVLEAERLDNGSFDATIPSPMERRQLVTVPTLPPEAKYIRVIPPWYKQPLIILAYGLFIETLGINATFAFDRASTLPDKVLMAVLGIMLEAMLFYLPSQASSLWTQRRWISCGFASILCIF